MTPEAFAAAELAWHDFFLATAGAGAFTDRTRKTAAIAAPAATRRMISRSGDMAAA